MNSNASACSENKGMGLRCVRYRFCGSARCEGYHPIDLAWLGRKDHEGVAQLRELLGGSHPLLVVPLRPDEPTDLTSLAELGAMLREQRSS